VRSFTAIIFVGRAIYEGIFVRKWFITPTLLKSILLFRYLGSSPIHLWGPRSRIWPWMRLSENLLCLLWSLQVIWGDVPVGGTGDENRDFAWVNDFLKGPFPFTTEGNYATQLVDDLQYPCSTPPKPQAYTSGIPMTITLCRIQQVLGPSPTGSLKVYGMGERDWNIYFQTFEGLSTLRVQVRDRGEWIWGEAVSVMVVAVLWNASGRIVYPGGTKVPISSSQFSSNPFYHTDVEVDEVLGRV